MLGEWVEMIGRRGEQVLALVGAGRGVGVGATAV